MITKVYLFIFLSMFLLQSFFPDPVSCSGANYRLSPRDKIFALHFLDKKIGFAVGDRGFMLFTEDGGENWGKRETSWDRPLNDVTFVGKKGWIVGNNGFILHTENGGKCWKSQESNSCAYLMKICFINEKKGAAIGQQEVIWTEDGGCKWHPSLLDWPAILPEILLERGVISPNLYGLFFLDEDHGWLVGDNGMVFFSPDGGKRWQVLRIGLYPPLYSVFFKNEQEGRAAGEGGLIIHSLDGGENWHPVNTPTNANLFKIREVSPDYLVAAGDLGTLLKSADGGNTWEKLEIDLRPPLPWLLDFALLSNPRKVLICVGEGTIRRVPLGN